MSPTCTCTYFVKTFVVKMSIQFNTAKKLTTWYIHVYENIIHVHIHVHVHVCVHVVASVHVYMHSVYTCTQYISNTLDTGSERTG